MDFREEKTHAENSCSIRNHRQGQDREKNGFQKWHKPVNHKRKADRDLLDVTVWRKYSQTVSVYSLWNAALTVEDFILN